jgi:ABC-2 type transport system permease protein
MLENAFNEVRINLALSKEGVNFERMKVISSIVDIKNIEVDEGEGGVKSQFLVLFFTSFIYIILLMMMILSSGGMLIRSLVEEKSNRLIEILVSSCSPDELLTGKVIGLSSLGIAQVLIWTMIGLSLVGLHIIPSQVFNNIIPILVYFAMGFIFYTSIFVGIGSIVTTEQEAQQITSYLSLVLVLPIVLTIPAMENPESILVQILSYIPFTIPSIMILRFNIGAVPTLDIITTSSVMVVSTYISVGIAARIFRIGVLSYGKRPSIKELITWIKEE